MILRKQLGTIVVMMVLVSCPMLATADTYTLVADDEQVVFVGAPQLGYVAKLVESKYSYASIAAHPLKKASDARRIRGLSRSNIRAVKNTGQTAANIKSIALLRKDSRVSYAAPLFSVNGEPVGVIPEIVVRVMPETSRAEIDAACKAAGCRIRKPMEFTEQEYLIELAGQDADAVFSAVQELNNISFVEWAWPNTLIEPKFGGEIVSGESVSGWARQAAMAGEDANIPGLFPNDEYFSEQWHLHNTGQSNGAPGADIRAPEAWAITTGDPNIVISVVDHGVDLSHPDLVGNLVAGHDFWDEDEVPEPGRHYSYGEDPHGTACAGLVAATGNNGIGVAGVTWGCKIMPGRVDVNGDMPTNEADIATTLRWAASNGADVLSCSWGFYGPLPIIHAAIVDITKPGGIGRNGKGCAFIGCAGNSTSFIWWPAVYSEVVAVGATTHRDRRASFSCYGPELDVAAPGDDVWTTDITGPLGYSFYNLSLPPDYHASFSGTSAATPIAAGVAALILSIEPDLTNDEVRHFLERSAKDLGDSGRDNDYGWGRVDARAALDMVLAKRADLNDDWCVDERDMTLLSEYMDSNDLSGDIAPAAKRDGIVDANDLVLLTEYMDTEIPEPGLLAHWRLDEIEGSLAHSSTGYIADVNGDPLWQPEGGMIDGALLLDGVNDYIRTPFILNPADGPLSVFAWINGGSPGQVIISQQDGVNWLMADADDGNLRTDLTIPPVTTGDRTEYGPSLTCSTVIIDGDWHRIGFVWDGKDRILYVDDVEVTRDDSQNPASAKAGLYIGAGSGLEDVSFFSGLIDDVKVYGRAVNPQD